MIKRIESVKYVDSESGFVFRFEPADDTLAIKKTKTGYEAKYLTQDEHLDVDDLICPDDNFFLVHYHRDFWVERKSVITENDLRSFYQGETIPQAEKYFIFPVSALIHSGVWLSLDDSFAFDPGGWDTSHVGAVLIRKTEYASEKEARNGAQGLVSQWNMVLSGDVWGIVKETYDREKKPVDCDSVWGHIGMDWAKEALKEF